MEKYDPSNRNMMSPYSPKSKKDKREVRLEYYKDDYSKKFKQLN